MPTVGPNGRPNEPSPIDAPMGTRLITSTPAATTMSYAPAITPCAAKWADCCDEPHWRSTVVDGTDSGNPAARTALRPMFTACAPTCMTQPMITSSTSAGSRSLRCTSAFSVSAARSAGCQPESLPLRLPPAVRTASTITAVVAMGAGPPPFRANLTERSSLTWGVRCGQTARAVRRFRWHHGTVTSRGHDPEHRLQRILEAQALLARVAADLGPDLDLHEVLASVLLAMRKVLDFRGGTVQLVDERGVYVAASDPPIGADVAELRLPVGQGLSGRVAATGHTIRSGDLEHDERVVDEVRRTGANAEMRSYLAVPLVCLGETIGALQIDSSAVDAFDEDDVTLLEGLAAQVAAVVESARRYSLVMELERLKHDFISRVSHELRTPLTIIEGFLAMMVDYEDQLSAEDRRDMLIRSRAATSRLDRLIEELIMLARFETGVITVHPERTSLRRIFDDVALAAADPDLVTIEASGEIELVVDADL